LAEGKLRRRTSLGGREGGRLNKTERAGGEAELNMKSGASSLSKKSCGFSVGEEQAGKLKIIIGTGRGIQKHAGERRRLGVEIHATA